MTRSITVEVPITLDDVQAYIQQARAPELADILGLSAHLLALAVPAPAVPAPAVPAPAVSAITTDDDDNRTLLLTVKKGGKNLYFPAALVQALGLAAGWRVRITPTVRRPRLHAYPPDAPEIEGANRLSQPGPGRSLATGLSRANQTMLASDMPRLADTAYTVPLVELPEAGLGRVFELATGDARPTAASE